ncbi:MAG: ABC transporter ATP-binding protein [Candidatus Omnitrophica bacterium]|nr:ABC transporter ATP-binding protein [Candidatus Omnitrophota bacterium]
MTYAIETYQLTKEFIPARSLYQLILHPFQKEKPTLAINNINLQIRRGELFCLVGPNGAGKTTLLKILSCLILPTKGKAEVAGYDILREEEKVKAAIGLVSGDERSFYWRLTLRQNLYFFAALYNLSTLQAKKKIEELTSLLEITSQLDKRFQECSTGIKQRLAIVRSLLNNPQVLFMDEPTKSLDYTTARNLRNFIKERLVKEQRKTIVFTTHNLSEVENFAQRIAIMYQGEVKACGTLKDLSDKINSPKATMKEIYAQITNNGGS